MKFLLFPFAQVDIAEYGRASGSGVMFYSILWLARNSHPQGIGFKG